MTEKINIEAILAKHGVEFGNMYNNPSKEDGLAAIKEIVEQVIEKCAEKAELMLKYPWVPEEKELELDKESILDVKQLIEYE